jgi:hypothetical protein
MGSLFEKGKRLPRRTEHHTPPNLQKAKQATNQPTQEMSLCFMDSLSSALEGRGSFLQSLRLFRIPYFVFSALASFGASEKAKKKSVMSGFNDVPLKKEIHIFIFPGRDAVR